MGKNKTCVYYISTQEGYVSQNSRLIILWECDTVPRDKLPQPA